MADDLSSFIEQQKNKLEKERAELTRDGNYNFTSQDRHGRKSPKEIEVTKRNIEQPSVKSTSNGNEESGLQLGGYAKHQQKLKEERRQEYIKFLAEKQLRTTGKVDGPALKEKDVSPITNAVNDKQESIGRRSIEGQYEKRDSPPPPRNRRRGKENYENNDDYVDGRGSRQYPAKESYEDLLRRKRADERKYRGFEGFDIDDELRQMKLASRNYKSSSRSDGFLSRRHDDDFDDDEFGYGRRSRRRNRNVESKRVRFHEYDDEDDNMDDRYWSRPPRRRLVNDYDEDEDDYLFDAIDKLKRQSRREGRRRNSAHEERTVNRQPVSDDSIRRTKTDNEIRSNSAPLPEGAGIIGSHIETREMKLKKQEKYKRELEEQMKLKESNKKKEKVERLGAPGEIPGNFLDSDRQQNQNTTPRISQQPALKQDPYNIPTANYGPSSRPPQHQSLYPSPYDDPYYYYGTQERGARTATALQDPLFNSPGYGSTGHYDGGTRGEPSLDHYQDRQERKKKVGFSPDQPAVSPRGGHVHQPPGGVSHLGGVVNIGQGNQEVDDKQNKRVAMQAYQEELRKQMEIKEQQKKKEKEELERYNKKIEDEVEKYNPWGKGGGGAPLRDVSTGQVIADLRGVNKDNVDGRKSANLQFNPAPVLDGSQLSPRSTYQSPQPPTYQPPQAYQQPASYQQSGNAAASNASPYGRSDPLKERQPNDDIKEKAKQEYQQYLRLQVEEKERKKKEEQDKIKAEEEKEERRLQEQRDRMQKEYLEEQEKIRKKEEEVKKQNEALLEAQNAKKQEAERKKKEMEDKRQEELRKKLEDEMAAKRATEAGNFRSDSPPIPTMRKQTNDSDQRRNSPPVPALTSKNSQVHSAKPSSPALSTVPTRMQSVTSVRSQNDSDVLSQLTALRQQLKNEEHKVQSQIGHTAAVNKYSQMSRVENESRRGKRDVSVFDRALTNKPAVTGRKIDSDYSAADEFNRIKQEETSSLAGEFRSRFPQPATTDSMLDLQQQEYLREQEDKLSSLRTGKPRHPNDIPGPSRSKSKDSLLESESQFIAVDDPAIPASKTDLQPRQPSARERRRWKQLEEMAKEPKPYDTYKPPTPGGFSLNSVTSFNVDEVATKNEERLKRLQAIQRAGGGGGGSNPDDVLKQFMSERGRPLTRTSEASLEAESSYEPVLNY